MEATLQKLKVTELKELLAKHHLVQTGKKDDLIKRLLDNKVSLHGVAGDDADDLVDPEPLDETAQASEPTNGNGPSEPTTSAQPPASSESEIPSTTTLTPEQQAMKARAERFGVPFNPNPTPTNKKPSNAKSTPKAAAEAPGKTETPKAKEKAGAIDKPSLGISEEVLAKRAAKFGIPEKKETNGGGKEAAAPAAATPKKAEEEVSPEVAERLAAEEEKKRKRAEKFGASRPAEESSAAEPEAKKSKA